MCPKKESAPECNPVQYKSSINVIEETYVEILNAITSDPTNYVGRTINIEVMFMTDENGKTESVPETRIQSPSVTSASPFSNSNPQGVFSG